MIYTGIKFFGQKIMVESTGDKNIDAAIKSVFVDDYQKTAPLQMDREDVQIALAWSRDEQKAGQLGLFSENSENSS